MNIKERIERLGEYFNSMNVAAENGIIYIHVKFDKGWGCSELTEYNYNVKCVKDETPGYFYFFADMEVGFDKIFDAIEYNIKFNEEAQEKVSLLMTKIEELKNIFENEQIDTLKTLEFKYKKKCPKKIKNKTKEDSIENIKENECVETETVKISDNKNIVESNGI